jgi:hypothetical protein
MERARKFRVVEGETIRTCTLACNKQNAGPLLRLINLHHDPFCFMCENAWIGVKCRDRSVKIELFRGLDYQYGELGRVHFS